MPENEFSEFRSAFERETLLRADAERSLERTPRLEDAMTSLRSMIESSESERKEGLLKLSREAEQKALDYVRAVIHHLYTERRFLLDPEDRNAADSFYNADKNRSRSHNAYIDTLNALLRNSLADGIEEARVIAEQLAGRPEDGSHRLKVADAAIAYVYRQVKALEKRKEE